MAPAFLVDWPKLELAAELALRRADELDGRRHQVLTAAAAALSDRRPHAATLLYRRMIDSTLERAASKSYSHLAEGVEGEIMAHADYVADLRKRHGRKTSFWSLVG